jgi:hypothetical protein
LGYLRVYAQFSGTGMCCCLGELTGCQVAVGRHEAVVERGLGNARVPGSEACCFIPTGLGDLNQLGACRDPDCCLTQVCVDQL